ncbi:MFS transporter [Leucobacter allii]|uniref:MFS transporter n=1 Tax=Leucobacter allii TaxID=2932247 RepID=A0ABY4FQ02_9MICO|nr:MFS transporter [Leucobacter allii]UOQ58355.1 MFS transporter [Leucobacter allii]UOR02934.1 MFS transporter [Leucobacter allii]
MRVPARLWAMLGVMVVAQAATTVVTAAPAFLIPHLHTAEGLSLAAAGLLAGAPNLGLVLSLVAWGAATDRFGERRVLLAGLALTVVAVAASMLVHGFAWLGVALVVGGALSACTNSASGRLITGWFPPERRGLAMGIRQTCQPLGMAIAALGVPPLAEAGGIPAALGLGGALTLVSLVCCAVAVRDPQRPPRAQIAAAGNPYRASGTLARIHTVSLLLVVPQFALSTFGLVWFTVGFGWSALAAGALVAGAQFAGAAGRILVGVWSDRVASRLGPLRLVAIVGIVALLATAACGWAEWAIPAAIAYVVASCVSVADNGLAFTAVAEIAGPGWAGRALGVQNTGQFLAAAAVGPVVGAAIGLIGVPAALALTALAPAIATPLVPRPEAERPAA